MKHIVVSLLTHGYKLVLLLQSEQLYYNSVKELFHLLYTQPFLTSCLTLHLGLLRID